MPEDKRESSRLAASDSRLRRLTEPEVATRRSPLVVLCGAVAIAAIAAAIVFGTLFISARASSTAESQKVSSLQAQLVNARTKEASSTAEADECSKAALAYDAAYAYAAEGLINGVDTTTAISDFNQAKTAHSDGDSENCPTK
jgi:hypothetical protein